MTGSSSGREVLREELEQVTVDAQRLALLLEALARAVEHDLPIDQAVQETCDTPSSRALPAPLLPSRWPHGAVSEVWVREQLEEAVDSLRRLHAAAASPLVAGLQGGVSDAVPG